MGNCKCNAFEATDELKEITNHGSCEQKPKMNLSKQMGSISSHVPEKVQKKQRAKLAWVVENLDEQVQDNVEMLSTEIESSDLIEIIKTLKKHFIFSQIPDKELDYVAKQLKPCSAAKNQYIFKQGDQSSAYYILLDGECDIIINGQTKKRLSFGSSFGELGIIYNAPRSASVRAATDCYLVRMDRKSFQKTMDDINSMNERENKDFLLALKYFQDLTEEQKNAVASVCLTETYNEGQVVFNLGDDANSFYVIKEGFVTIKEKDIDIKPGQSFGEKAFTTENGVRTNTIVAKTNCKLISISRENLIKTLGGNIHHTIQKNSLLETMTKCELYPLNSNEEWKEAVSNCEIMTVQKGSLLFPQAKAIVNEIYVALHSDLVTNVGTFNQKSIIAEKQLLKQKQIMFSEDVIVTTTSQVAKIKIRLLPKTKKVAIKQVEVEKVQLHFQNFYIVRKLRSGNFGQVYAAYNTVTKKLYAIKLMNHADIEKAQITKFVQSQQEILRMVDPHPFLMGFHSVIRDENNIYFILQLIQGEDMFDMMSKMPKLTIEQICFLMSQILMVIQHLHKQNIVYRDLKPENLMMGLDGYLVLVDMGTAKKLTMNKRFKTNTIIGTPHYMAPQTISGRGYSFQVDLWGLGVICYELMCNKLPFGESHQDPFKIYEDIINSSVKFPRNCNKNLKNLIEKLMKKNPQARIGTGFEELKKSKFFENLNWEGLLQKELKSFYTPDCGYHINDKEIERTIKKDKNKAINVIKCKTKQK